MNKRTYRFLDNFKSHNILVVRKAFIVTGVFILLMFFIVFIVKAYYEVDPIAYLSGIVQDFAINIGSAIITGIVVLFFWQQIASAIEIKEKTFVISEIDNALKGIKRTGLNIAYDKATQFIATCSEIRVIGSVSFDHINKDIQESIDKYFAMTLARIGDGEKIKYRRIAPIPDNPKNDKFYEHLGSCFEAKVDNQDIEMMLMDSFPAACTFLIVDDKFLMLSLNFPDLSSGIKREHCYVTQNAKIIEDYIEYFRRVWREVEKSTNVINSCENYKKVIPFYKHLNEYSKQIKNALSNISVHPEIEKNHAIKEIEYAAIKLGSLAENRMEINHTIANGSLVQLLCMYMEQMKSNDIYETVTFYRFWKEIVDRGSREPDFVGKTKECLSNGAKISRIMIIDDTKIEYPSNFIADSSENIEMFSRHLDYCMVIRKAVNKNIEIVKEFPEQYDFRILFSRKHDEYFHDFYNFALITTFDKESKKSTQILFEPDAFTKSESTKLSIHNCAISKSKNINNDKIRKEIEEKIKKKKELENSIRNQKIEQIHINFLKEIDIEYFDDENNIGKHLK